MCDEFARKALAENSNITMDICRKVIKNFTPSVSQEDIEYYKSFME
jgi:SpoVK/Ycf46/Vps4 family AAA+-type ATPase